MMKISQQNREDLDVNEVIDTIPVAVVILDADFCVQVMNRTAEAMLGISRQQAVGIPCRHIVRSNLCLRDCPAREVLREERAVRRQGNVINCSRQKIPVAFHVDVLRDSKGRLLGIVETLEDISLVEELDKKIHARHEFGDMVGLSPKMQKLFDILPIISQTDSSVLITGETGTGKDRVAEIIHRLSPRTQGAFVKINCGALPESLLESELFGHTRGAFTGAVRDKPGRFQLANNGSVYLTEIGDLPLPLQVKLLTFLDDKEIIPLGGTKTIKADVRLIAATHRDLHAMVQKGAFREDLFYRLNVVRLELPPLRERDGDIRLLMEHFLNQFNQLFQKKIKGFSRKAIEVLSRYPYPGNVRELKNIVEYAANVCRESSIQPEHLPDYLKNSALREVVAMKPADLITRSSVVAPPAEQTAVQAGVGALDWRSMERRLIMEALSQTSGNRTKAAKLLGWGRSTLWRKMKQHKLI
ncbi:MAG: sigma 54-interacting transcriptional regulator [Deltaproteobacteria bacterium]|nr:sigma 54-interacting transcriptional regulator [Deltaproteobacteria bacterium]MBW2071553.1 sigma 54-interacting transcriptional regulator [Deltaproteobacteria bacterium]